MKYEMLDVAFFVGSLFAAAAWGLASGYHYAQSRAAVSWFRESMERGRRHDANVARVKSEFRAAAEAEANVQDEDWPDQVEL